MHTYKMFLVRFFFKKKFCGLSFDLTNFYYPKLIFLTKEHFQNKILFFLFILVFILIIYLLVFIDKKFNPIRICGQCITNKVIKISQNSYNNQMKPPKQYLIFICMGKTKLEHEFVSAPKYTNYLMKYQSHNMIKDA